MQASDRSIRTDPSLTAVFHPVQVDKLDLTKIKTGDTVVLYTKVKNSRPWTAVVLKVDAETLTVHWLRKRKSQYEMEFNSDGSPHSSQVPTESVMFVDALLNSSTLLNSAGPYSLDEDMKRQIMTEYRSRDEVLRNESNMSDSITQTSLNDEVVNDMPSLCIDHNVAVRVNDPSQM